MCVIIFSYKIYGKYNGVEKSMFGISISLVNLSKTILVSLLIVLSYFILLNFIYFLFHIDYRFIFISSKVFNKETLYILPVYFPFFFLFFLSNSLRINGSIRFKNGIRLSPSVLYTLATSGGLITILFIQYATFWFTGIVFWKEGWLYVNLLFSVVPILLVLPFFQKFFFEHTGSVYLGPLTMTQLFSKLTFTSLGIKIGFLPILDIIILPNVKQNFSTYTIFASNFILYHSFRC